MRVRANVLRLKMAGYGKYSKRGRRVLVHGRPRFCGICGVGGIGVLKCRYCCYTNFAGIGVVVHDVMGGILQVCTKKK